MRQQLERWGIVLFAQQRVTLHSWVLYLFVGPLIKFLPVPTPTSVEPSQILVNVYVHGIAQSDMAN